MGIVRIYTKKLLLQNLHLWYFIPSMVFSSFNFTTSARAMQKFKSSKFQNLVVSLPVVSLTMNLKCKFMNSETWDISTSTHIMFYRQVDSYKSQIVRAWHRVWVETFPHRHQNFLCPCNWPFKTNLNKFEIYVYIHYNANTIPQTSSRKNETLKVCNVSKNV